MKPIRNVLATLFMFIAVIFKVACIAVAHKDNKEAFRENI
jgi:hypothetical protein